MTKVVELRQTVKRLKDALADASKRLMVETCRVNAAYVKKVMPSASIRELRGWNRLQKAAVDLNKAIESFDNRVCMWAEKHHVNDMDVYESFPNFGRTLK